MNNKEYNTAVGRGMQAWANGKLLIENPYTTGSELYFAWEKGYESASESNC